MAKTTFLTNENSDLLVGTQGADVFDATQGGDATMFGLGGNDIYIVDSSDDVANEALGGGIDTIVGFGMCGEDYTLGANIENFRFDDTHSDSNNNIIEGNSLANVISGGTGYDTIYGDSNSRMLTAGANDTLNGGAAGDTIYGDTIATLYAQGGNDVINANGVVLSGGSDG